MGRACLLLFDSVAVGGITPCTYLSVAISSLIEGVDGVLESAAGASVSSRRD